MEDVTDSAVQILSGLDGLAAWRTTRVEDAIPRGVSARPFATEVQGLQGTSLALDLSTVTDFASRYKWYLGGAALLGLGFYLWRQGKLPFLSHPTAVSAAQLSAQVAGLGYYGHRRRRRRRAA